MEPIEITNIETYIKYVKIRSFSDRIISLYRGQTKDYSLLPAIAREKPSFNTTEIEKEMLSELKRRSQNLNLISLMDDWDWLVYAQHFGMKTRLLDWTSNPLAALWFACKSEQILNQDSFVYIFHAKKDSLLDRTKNNNPFISGSTKILKPPQNNSRIVSQSGWFTAHNYSTSNSKFVGLEKNKKYKNHIVKLFVPANKKKKIHIELNMLGVSHQSMFPDFEGICRQINWEKLS